MDNAVNLWVVLKHLINRLLICNVQMLELGALPTDQLYAIIDLGRGVVQVVGHHNVVAGFKQRKGCERTNVTGSTAQSSLVSHF